MALLTGQVQIRDGDRPTLVSWSRSSSVRALLMVQAHELCTIKRANT